MTYASMKIQPITQNLRDGKANILISKSHGDASLLSSFIHRPFLFLPSAIYESTYMVPKPAGYYQSAKNKEKSDDA